MVAENDSFQVAVYGNHGIKYIYFFKDQFIFQNSDIILAISRLYVTILIGKINLQFSLFPSAHEFICHTSSFFSSELTNSYCYIEI